MNKDKSLKKNSIIKEGHKYNRLTDAEIIVLETLILKEIGSYVDPKTLFSALKLAFEEQAEKVTEIFMKERLPFEFHKKQKSRKKRKHVEPLKVSIGDMLKAKKEG